MPDLIAVIDRRMPDQAGAAYAFPGRTWVVGAVETLEVDGGWPMGRIIDWVDQAAARHGDQVDLDLICHGHGAHVHEPARTDWTLLLGHDCLYSVNVGRWAQVHGLLRRIRVYACGVEAPDYGPGVWTSGSAATQHWLMAKLALVTGARVKYSLTTTSGDVQARATSQSYDTDRMAAPVFVAQPTGVWTRVR